jgi:hypothetical protein
MRRATAFAIIFGLALSLAAALAVLAHGGSGEAKIVVEPASVTAGDSVVLAGSGLEPDSDRVLLLAGGDLVVEFGTVKTDAEGMFSKELTIPSHLPSGNYELRAIGDETLTTPLAVTALAGGAGTSPAANDASETVLPRERTSFEFGAIFVFVALTSIVGALLVWRAERFRGPARA